MSEQDEAAVEHGPYLEVTHGADGKYGYADEYVHITTSEHSTSEFIDISVSAVSDAVGADRHDAGVKLTLSEPQRQDLIRKLKEVGDE